MNDIEKDSKKLKKRNSKVNKVKKMIEEKNKTTKNSFNTIEVIVIMVITALFGALIGSGATYFFGNGGIKINNKNIKQLISIYDELVNNYYGEIDNEELLESGIEGMINYLSDPYSSYLDATVSEEFNEKIEGEYIGLGAEISMNLKTKVLTVTKILDNSPAKRSGLKEKDIIIEVAGKKAEELELEEITEIIKNGEIGTAVELKVLRNDKEVVVEFERGVVELTSVTGEVIEQDDKKIGLVTISVFAKNSHKQFERVIENLKEQKVDGLIIDIRDNSGGYLTTVKSIANMFLNKKDVIFIIKDKDGEEKQLSNKKKEIELPTVVLINGGSASASEILAAALNENLGIELVGLNTYGKGTVQKTKTLSSGAIVKYTIQEWLTPSGKSIEDNGIAPTVEIEQDKKYYDNPIRENDNQLQKALEILLTK